MKRSTAIGRLVDMAEVATERLRLRDSDIGWPLEELWVTGELLGLADTVDAGAVVLDVPADELPWLSVHPRRRMVGDQLRLGKRPIRWCYRPLAWPVWNHEHRRLVARRAQVRVIRLHGPPRAPTAPCSSPPVLP